MEEPWSLEKIQVSTGEGFRRKELHAGVLYASDRRTVGPSTFLKIKQGSLLMFELALPTVVAFVSNGTRVDLVKTVFG